MTRFKKLGHGLNPRNVTSIYKNDFTQRKCNLIVYNKKKTKNGL